MNICGNGHEEVCYEGHRCPACELLDTILEIQKENEKLERELDNVRAERDTLMDCIPAASS